MPPRMVMLICSNFKYCPSVSDFGRRLLASATQTNCSRNRQSEALEHGGCAPEQYGRGGIQTCRPWSHLSEAHLRRLRSKHAELEVQRDQGADPEDPDEYRAESFFWVPKEARWDHLKDNAPQAKIGTIVDEATAAIERDNPSLRGVLPRDYSRPAQHSPRRGRKA